MEDILGAPQDISLLSLHDLLTARDLFHRHLMNRRHVVATAVGKYLIRKNDPWPSSDQPIPPRPPGPREERRLDNSEVRPYSPPCILVFVDEWIDEDQFVGDRDDGLSARDLVPKALYLPNGFTVPVCVVSLKKDTEPPPPLNIQFPTNLIGGGYPVTVTVQGQERIGSIACLITDGHLVYALTNRHVIGEPGTPVFTEIGGEQIEIGLSSDKQLTKLPFTTVYPGLPGQRVLVNLDIGLIRLHDLDRWTAQVYGVGQLGPLADLNAENVSLRLIGAHVRAHGAVSGPLVGEIAALFYRYKSMGGFEYIADFLIGPRSVNGVAVRSERGDSGTLWMLETRPVKDAPAQPQNRGAANSARAVQRVAGGQDGAAEDPADMMEPADTRRWKEPYDEYEAREWAEGNRWAEVERETDARRADSRPPNPFAPADDVVYRPLAVQWGGEVLEWADNENRTYVLASSLSASCRLLDLDLLTTWNGGLPEYWGQRGHYTVASLAVDQLFSGRLRTLLRVNLENISYPSQDLRRNTSGQDTDGFVRLANVADLVWKDGPPKPGPFERIPRENPNHYAPLDKPRQPDNLTLLDLCNDPGNVDIDVWAKYYDDADIQKRSHGILPFRVQQIYQKMVEYASDGDRVGFVCAAGLLAHYVGDACQPLHCSFMSDGIPLSDGTRDGKGVHEQYEGDMIDSAFSQARPVAQRLVPRLPAAIAALTAPPLVTTGPAAARAMVELMRLTLEDLPPKTIITQFKADPSATVMWDKLGDKTVKVIARGVLYLAMLWRSAWNQGNGAANIGDLSEVSHDDLRALYESNDPNTEFLRSCTIDDIKDAL